MDELDEIYAACIIEYARRHNGGVLIGPFYVIGKEARDAFNLPYSEKLFEQAVGILEDINVLSRYQREGMQTFFRIDTEKFDSAMKDSGLGVRHYTMLKPFEDGPRAYKFLEAFYDIGSDYLREALESYERKLAEIGEDGDGESQTFTEPTSIDSSTWTGRQVEPLDESRRSALVRELDRVEAALDSSEVPQHQRAQARAIIVAARALTEAPEPQMDLVWELLSRANAIAGIGSFFVSLVALFTAAAN